MNVPLPIISVKNLITELCIYFQNLPNPLCAIVYFGSGRISIRCFLFVFVAEKVEVNNVIM